MDDRQCLADLVHRYAAHVDDRDFDGVGQLFTDDGRLVLPDPPQRCDPVLEHVGRDAVVQAIAGVEAFVRTIHAVVGVVHDLDPDGVSARGRIACVAHHVLPERDGEQRDLTWFLRYDDTYERVDGARPSPGGSAPGA